MRGKGDRFFEGKEAIAFSLLIEFFNRGFLGLYVAPQLQTLAQRETLKKIEKAACDQEILKQANDKAQLVVEKLLSTAGHKEVVVKTQAPTPGSYK